MFIVCEFLIFQLQLRWRLYNNKYHSFSLAEIIFGWGPSSCHAWREDNGKNKKKGKGESKKKNKGKSKDQEDQKKPKEETEKKKVKRLEKEKKDAERKESKAVTEAHKKECRKATQAVWELSKESLASHSLMILIFWCPWWYVLYSPHLVYANSLWIRGASVVSFGAVQYGEKIRESKYYIQVDFFSRGYWWGAHSHPKGSRPWRWEAERHATTLGSTGRLGEGKMFNQNPKHLIPFGW